jgi:hypothetical protein
MDQSAGCSGAEPPPEIVHADVMFDFGLLRDRLADLDSDGGESFADLSRPRARVEGPQAARYGFIDMARSNDAGCSFMPLAWR